MEWRYDIINKIIQGGKFTSYLEVGIGGKVNWENVKCERKTCVEPFPQKPEFITNDMFVMTSDEFFEEAINMGMQYDCVFLDGLHLCEQLRKDIINASKVLTKKGAILMHDVNPKDKISQEVPMKTPYWNGDCWKSFVGFRQKYPDVKTDCFLGDHGVGIIYPDGQIFEGEFENIDIIWEEFESNKIKYLKGE